MNKHDQKRKEALINTLNKAREQAENCKLYLTARDVSLNADNLVAITGAMAHIDEALEQLGGAVHA